MQSGSNKNNGILNFVNEDNAKQFIQDFLYEVEQGNIDIVKYLLDNKALINVIDNYQNTPLMLAHQHNRQEIVEIILKRTECSTDYSIKFVQEKILCHPIAKII